MMRLALTTVAVLAVAAAGCGGVENEPNLAKAAERTEETGSFAITVSEEAPTGQGSGFACEGVVDIERSRARMSCSEGDVAYEFVVDDETMYLTSSEVAPKWSKMPLNEMDEVDQLAPESILEVLRSRSETTERIGEEDVAGDPTVRYAFSGDCEQAPVLGCEGEVLANVWIDEDGLVRQVRFDNSGSRVSIEFSDFGVPVEIEPPPADQVVEGGLGETGFETEEIETGEVETTPAP